MAVWELNPEVLGSLWLMASATWDEITLAEGLHDRGRRAVPLLTLKPKLVLIKFKKSSVPQRKHDTLPLQRSVY
jgi:hypothetical protein